MLQHSVVKHTIASASTAVGETLLFVLLVNFTRFSPNSINVSTIIIGTTANYLINKFWVFGSSNRPWHFEAGHFFIVAGIALVAQSLFFGLFFALLHASVISKLIALTLGFLINYPLKRWVFHEADDDKKPSINADLS